MLNKIIYTILGFSVAFVFLPHPAKDAGITPAISGASTTNIKNTIIPAPELAVNIAAPILTAKSGLAIDLDSGLVLYSKNLDDKLPIASLTKLMTALIVMDNSNPTEVVTIDKNDTNVIGTSVGLVAGEKITVADLLKAMLIPSSNDAALVLSKFSTGDENSFVTLMNIEAARLGLNNTHFANPVGWDSDDNYSDTLDLVKIVKEFLKNPELAQIVRTKETTISSVDGKYIHLLTTTNKLLLDDPEVIGVKTGFTSKALGNLIILANHNGRNILTIILGSDNREDDSQKLLEWVLMAYRW